MEGTNGLLVQTSVKPIRAISIRFKGLRIVLFGSMLSSILWSPSLASTPVAEPSESFLLHCIPSLPLSVSAGIVSFDIKFSEILWVSLAMQGSSCHHTRGSTQMNLTSIAGFCQDWLNPWVTHLISSKKYGLFTIFLFSPEHAFSSSAAIR